jgi:hypothetical protein
MSGAVELRVFDVLGREVRSLVDGHVASGRHQVQFDAGDLPAGLYFYTLQAADARETRRMLLVR